MAKQITVPVKKLIKQDKKVEPKPLPTLPVLTGEKQAVSVPEQKKLLKKGPPTNAFPPGISGNPNGRPPGRKSWATLVREALLEKDQKTGKTGEETVIQNIIKLGKKGNHKMIELMWAYIDGKPNQPMDHNLINNDLSDEEREALSNLMKKNL